MEKHAFPHTQSLVQHVSQHWQELIASVQIKSARQPGHLPSPCASQMPEQHVDPVDSHLNDDMSQGTTQKAAN